jgi:hypothetical protein
MTATARFLATPLCILLVATPIAGCGDHSDSPRASVTLPTASTSGKRERFHSSRPKHDKPTSNRKRSDAHSSRRGQDRPGSNQIHRGTRQRRGDGRGSKQSHPASDGDRAGADEKRRRTTQGPTGANAGPDSTGGHPGFNRSHPDNSSSNDNSDSGSHQGGGGEPPPTTTGDGHVPDQPTTTNQVHLGSATPLDNTRCPDEFRRRHPQARICEKHQLANQFGPVALGSSSTLAYALTSATGRSVTIRGIEILGANARDFRLDSGSCAIGAVIHDDQSCTLYITFIPQAQGFRRAVLIIQMGPDSFAAAVLQGSGRPAPATTTTTPTATTTTPTPTMTTGSP